MYKNIEKYEKELKLNEKETESIVINEIPILNNYTAYFKIIDGWPSTDQWYTLVLMDNANEKYILYIPNRESLDNYWDYKIEMGANLKSVYTEITLQNDIYKFSY